MSGWTHVALTLDVSPCCTRRPLLHIGKIARLACGDEGNAEEVTDCMIADSDWVINDAAGTVRVTNRNRKQAGYSARTMGMDTSQTENADSRIPWGE